MNIALSELKKNVTISKLKKLKRNDVCTIEMLFGNDIKIIKIYKTLVRTRIFGNVFADMENDDYTLNIGGFETIYKDCVCEKLYNDIVKLSSAKTIGEFNYLRGLISYNVIESEDVLIDSKKCMIAPFISDYDDQLYTNIKYIPYNKDGKLSKAKPRMMYKNKKLEKLI